jgi:hypothetical protein
LRYVGGSGRSVGRNLVSFFLDLNRGTYNDECLDTELVVVE